MTTWASWVYDTDIQTLVQNSVMPGIADTIGDMSPTMKLFMNNGNTDAVKRNTPTAKKGFIYGGAKIEKLVRIAELTARGTHKGHETVNLAPNRTKDLCKQGFARYYSAISVSKDEASAVRGTKARVNLIQNKTDEAHAAIMQMIATGIFNYDALLVPGNEQFHGLNGLGQLCGRRVGDTNYGGEAREWMEITSDATDTWWDCGYMDYDQHTVANQLDSTNDSYLPKIFGELVDGCSVGSYRPTVLITTKAIWNNYQTVVRNLQQINEPVTGDLGFQFLKFQGIPVVWDDSCPQYHVYAINMKPAFGNEPTIGIHGREGEWFTQAGWVRSADQLVDSNIISVDLNMWCDNPRLHGALVRVEE